VVTTRASIAVAGSVALLAAAACNQIAGINEAVAGCTLDGVVNGLETDVDCGGGCLPCDVNKKCNDPDDCVSAACFNKKCVEACPYKKPMYRATTRVSEKCIACYPRVEGTDPLTEGLPMETRCMSVCPGKIRLQGLVEIGKDGQWVEDPENPIYYLVQVAKVALPLYPQFGTEPNGYYIPPRWVPRDHLRQMFGPGVDHAIETYLAPPRELLAVMQLFRATQRIIFRFRIEKGPKVRDVVIGGKPWAMYNDTVIGYDRAGNEVANLSVLEPFHVRPRKYPNSI
jgi:nitrate reductase beta subunit